MSTTFTAPTPTPTPTATTPAAPTAPATPATPAVPAPQSPGTTLASGFDALLNSMLTDSAPPAQAPAQAPSPAPQPAETAPPTPPTSPTPPTPPVAPAEPATPELDLDEDAYLFDGLTPQSTATTNPDPTTPAAEPTPGTATPDAAAPTSPAGPAGPDDSKIIDLSSPRGQRIYAAYKTVKALTEPPEKGGLGRTFTAEEVRNWHDNAANWESFSTELATPAAAESVAANLLDIAGASTPALAQQFIKQTYQRNLAGDQAAQAAYRQVGQYIASNLIDELVSVAREESDSAWKSAYFGAAKVLKSYLTGRAESLPDDLLNQPAADPLAEREAALRAREEALANRDTANTKSHWQNYVASTVAAADATLRSSIETALSGPNGSFKAAVPPLIFQSVVAEFERAVSKSVNSNPNAQREFRLLFTQARQNATNQAQADEYKSRIGTSFMRYANTAIAGLRKQYLSDMARAAKQANGAIHTQRQQTADVAREPSTTAAPTTQPLTIPALNPQPGESPKQLFNRTFDALLS